jgi:hypothetical protein
MLVRKRPTRVAPRALRPPTVKPMALCVPAMPADVARTVPCRAFRVGAVTARFNKHPELAHRDRRASHPKQRRTRDGSQIESDLAVEVKRQRG